MEFSNTAILCHPVFSLSCEHIGASVANQAENRGVVFSYLMIIWCAFVRMQEAQNKNANSIEDAKPSKKRRLLELPDCYKKEKVKLDFEGKEVYLIRAPGDVSTKMLCFAHYCYCSC